MGLIPYYYNVLGIFSLKRWVRASKTSSKNARTRPTLKIWSYWKRGPMTSSRKGAIIARMGCWIHSRISSRETVQCEHLKRQESVPNHFTRHLGRIKEVPLCAGKSGCSSCISRIALTYITFQNHGWPSDWGYLPFTRKTWEIPVGTWNGTHHSIWNFSEIMMHWHNQCLNSVLF